jgi:hypothetical protein
MLCLRAGLLTGSALAGAVFGVACSPRVAPAMQTPIQVVAPTITSTPSMVPTLPPTAAPTQPATPTNTPVLPTVAVTPVSNTQLKLDVDAIFPSGKGRDLVLNNCTVCHTFLRVVVGQRTKDQWEYVRRDMRGKVSQLSDQDIDTLFVYLEANFNETKPVPNLPDWFLQTGEW